jgi:hypothetical protein
MMLVGRLINGGGGGGGSHGRVVSVVCSSVASLRSSPICSLSFIMPTSARVHANQMFYTHLQHIANTQERVIGIDIKVQADGLPISTLEQVRDLTLRPVLPLLGVRVRVCVPPPPTGDRQCGGRSQRFRSTFAQV